jgi:hypothetical protein
MSDLDAPDMDLQLLQTATPPAPPSSALLASVNAMRPVRMRVPLRTLLAVAAAAVVFPTVAMVIYPLRRDLGALPPVWFAAVAVVWLAGIIIPLSAGLLPPPGQVLPDGARARRTAILASLTLVLTGLLFTVDVPGVTILPATRWAGFAHLWWHCISFSLKVTIPAVFVAALGLRKLAAAHLGRLGAAIGAAAGALSGLTLHGLCPFGGGAHVGLAHGGGVVIGAVIGALWLPVVSGLAGFARRRRRP